MLSQTELESLVAAGDIDTVIVAFCDMQGRLTGKRVAARLFVEDVAPAAIPVDGYLAVGPVTPDSARLQALAAPPERRQWWIDRVKACYPLLVPSCE